MRNLIGREDSSTAQAADAKFEPSKGLIIDPAAGAETRQLGRAQAEATRQRFGETRKSTRGSTQERAVTGQPENRGNWEPQAERRAGATRKFQPQARPEERGSGESRGNRHWQTGGHKSRGNLAGTPAGPQDSGSGATRGSNRRRYRTSGARGNSHSGSRRRRKMKRRGNLVLHHGKAGDAGRRATGDRRQ